MAGSPVKYYTRNGDYVEGVIQRVKNDSIWVLHYHTQKALTVWYTTVMDTVSVYLIKTHYKKIARIYITSNKNALPLLAGKLMLAGGSGYMALNVFNTFLAGGRPTEKRNLQQLYTAGGIAASGFIFKKFFKKDGFSRKRHRIVYVNLQQ